MVGPAASMRIVWWRKWAVRLCHREAMAVGSSSWVLVVGKGQVRRNVFEVWCLCG